MKKWIKNWLIVLLFGVMSLSLWGCGNSSTGEEELDQAIVDMVMEGVNSYLEGENASSDTPILTETPAPTQTLVPTETQTPTLTLTLTPVPTETQGPTPTLAPMLTPTETPEPGTGIEETGWYYSKEEVALYLHTYQKLPGNYLTKTEAKETLGWTGGGLPDGYAIGGDKFGNREGLLPKENGRQYYECDIDTNGKGSRGVKRIVFSNDGLIYYTEDHYASFTLLYGEK